MNIINKIFFSFIFGFFFSIYLFQNNQSFKSICENKIVKIAKEVLDCDINLKIKSINLFLPELYLENVILNDKDNKNWQWNCKKLKIKCSWLDFLFFKKFKCDIEIYKINAISNSFNGDLSILPHIKKIIFEDKSNIPISIKRLSLDKSNIKIHEVDYDIKTDLDFKGELKKIDNISRIIIYLTKGKLENKSLILSDEISGTGQINIVNNLVEAINIKGSCLLPSLDEHKECYFFGQWNDKKRFLRISTIDGKLNIGPFNIYNKNNKLHLDLILDMPIDYLQKILKINSDSKFQGNCLLKLTTDIKKEDLKGQFLIKNLHFKTSPNSLINELKINFIKKNKYWNGNIIIDKGEEFYVHGNLKIKEEQGDRIANGRYLFHIKSNKLEKNKEIQGEIKLSKDNIIQLIGIFNFKKYKLECQLKPNLIFKNFLYFENRNSQYLKVSSDDSNRIKLAINFDYFKNWIPDSIKQYFFGCGEIILNGKYYDNKINGTIDFNNVNLKIPNTYNFVKKIHGLININFQENKVNLNHCNIDLHKGNIECNNIVMLFDDYLSPPKFIHLPISIKNCFVNFKKDILGLLSGKIYLIRNINENKINLNGYLLIDKCQIKNNIFSDEFRNEIFKLNYANLPITNESNLNLNISLLSKDLIKVRTPFLNTKIQLDLKLLDDVYRPKISGYVELAEGTISFPYKKLKIKNGNISFLPNQTYDPIINLTAKNKIKKYNIIMYVTGSAQSPNIKFESSPPLTDEQIVSLLLVGSENGAMNMIMPAIVMQNIKNIILGSSQIHTKTRKYFDTILKPFKYINFVPSFNNETGRGGITGIIEINVNDRLNASIQKGFTFAEDTRFEFNYAATDEINLKAVKDERGDLAGEVEMRWKF